MQETYQRLGANRNCTIIRFCHHPYVIGTVYRKKQEIRNRFPSLKSKLNADKVRPPSYYNYSQRTLQIYHTRLRLECSSLKFHLYKSKIVDSPLCDCGEVETTKHYLIHYPQHHIPRNQFLTNFLDKPIKTLLHGYSRLTLAENEEIFNAVQTFIAHTKRFS